MSAREGSAPGFWLWDSYFLVVAVAVSAAILPAPGYSSARRAGAVAAIAVMVALHALIGRRLIRRDAENTAALLVCLGHMVLFAAAIACVPLSTWLMFAVLPVFFMMVPLRPAIVLVVVANVTPVLLQLRRGSDGVGLAVVVAVISTGAGVCIGLWITRMVRQSQDRAALIAELEASRAELARLAHEAGVAAERNRLAGEIHDTLAQGFTSIITLVQAADPALADERLALVVRTARENLAESRALIAALSPSALASASLHEAVRRQAARFSEEAGVPCAVRVAGEPRDLRTPVEVVLLRATQEALTNVRRHAGAREVAVLLAYHPDRVRLVVHDDGRGFDPGSATGGYGLSGMRARAAQVGGAVTVHASGGTTIEVEVPA